MQVKIRRTSIVPLIVFAVCVIPACNSGISQVQSKEARIPGNNETAASPADTLAFTVSPAPEWDQLFYRNKGWFGGDGIFSVTKNGVEQNGSSKSSDALIWFSDSMIGDIDNDSLKPGYSMINNSIASLTGGMPDSNNMKFTWDLSSAGKPKSMFIPSTRATRPGDYYWLGDGFVNQEKNSDLYIFGYRIRNIPDRKEFGFEEVGNTLIVVKENAIASLDAATTPPAPSLVASLQLDIPFYQNEPVDSVGSFGAAILVNTNSSKASKTPDGYIYIYGVKGQHKDVIVSRVKPASIEAFSDWRFWNGTAWTTNPHDVKPIADHASNEMSVTPLPDGRYLMIFQEDGYSPYVSLRTGATPYGPFGPIQRVYDASNDLKESGNFFVYNAKAHPVLSEPGELLISYNLNSFDFHKEIRQWPHLYRPRFIKLKYRLR